MNIHLAFPNVMWKRTPNSLIACDEPQQTPSNETPTALGRCGRKPLGRPEQSAIINRGTPVRPDHALSSAWKVIISKLPKFGLPVAVLPPSACPVFGHLPFLPYTLFLPAANKMADRYSFSLTTFSPRCAPIRDSLWRLANHS